MSRIFLALISVLAVVQPMSDMGTPELDEAYPIASLLQTDSAYSRPVQMWQVEALVQEMKKKLFKIQAALDKMNTLLDKFENADSLYQASLSQKSQAFLQIKGDGEKTQENCCDAVRCGELGGSLGECISYHSPHILPVTNWALLKIAPPDVQVEDSMKHCFQIDNEAVVAMDCDGLDERLSYWKWNHAGNLLSSVGYNKLTGGSDSCLNLLEGSVSVATCGTKSSKWEMQLVDGGTDGIECSYQSKTPCQLLGDCAGGDCACFGHTPNATTGSTGSTNHSNIKSLSKRFDASLTHLVQDNTFAAPAPPSNTVVAKAQLSCDRLGEKCGGVSQDVDSRPGSCVTLRSSPTPSKAPGTCWVKQSCNEYSYGDLFRIRNVEEPSMCLGLKLFKLEAVKCTASPFLLSADNWNVLPMKNQLSGFKRGEGRHCLPSLLPVYVSEMQLPDALFSCGKLCDERHRLDGGCPGFNIRLQDFDTGVVLCELPGIECDVQNTAGDDFELLFDSCVTGDEELKIQPVKEFPGPFSSVSCLSLCYQLPACVFAHVGCNDMDSEDCTGNCTLLRAQGQGRPKKLKCGGINRVYRNTGEVWLGGACEAGHVLSTLPKNKTLSECQSQCAAMAACRFIQWPRTHVHDGLNASTGSEAAGGCDLLSNCVPIGGSEGHWHMQLPSTAGSGSLKIPQQNWTWWERGAHAATYPSYATTGISHTYTQDQSGDSGAEGEGEGGAEEKPTRPWKPLCPVGWVDVGDGLGCTSPSTYKVNQSIAVKTSEDENKNQLARDIISKLHSVEFVNEEYELKQIKQISRVWAPSTRQHSYNLPGDARYEAEHLISNLVVLELQCVENFKFFNSLAGRMGDVASLTDAAG